MRSKTKSHLFHSFIQCFLLLISPKVAISEGKASSIFASHFNVTNNRRQNICNRQREIFADESNKELRNALSGLSINIAVANDDPYFVYDENAERITEDTYPGAIVDILDLLAKEANFTWRDSFTYLGPPKNNMDWTDYIEWTSENFDVTAGYFIRTVNRLKLGITFPEGWYDATIIMVTFDRSKKHFDSVAWTRPFTPFVWYMILATVVLSGFIIVFFEGGTGDAGMQFRSQRCRSLCLTGISASALTFTTGDIRQDPRQITSRIFSISLTFVALLVGAAYTANLANFLIADTESVLNIQSLDDAVAAGQRLCIQEKTATYNVTQGLAPSAKFVERYDEADALLGLDEGSCDIAVVTMTQWKTFEKNSTLNGGCNKKWIGRAIAFFPAGFTMRADSGYKCTNLIRDVFNLYMIEQKTAIDSILEKHTDYHSLEASCDQQVTSTDDVEMRLDIIDMSSIFLLHLIVSFIAISMELVKRYKKRNVRKNLDSILEKAGEDELTENPVLVDHGSSVVSNKSSILNHRPSRSGHGSSQEFKSKLKKAMNKYQDEIMTIYENHCEDNPT